MDDYETVMFASELNISNGFVEQWGERYMFGKLESASRLREAHREFNEYEISYMALEVRRLLLGPWTPPGSTEFTQITPKFTRYRALIVDTWEWIDSKNLTLIRVKHTTDRYGGVRYALLGVVPSGVFGEVLPDLARYDVYLVREPNI